MAVTFGQQAVEGPPAPPVNATLPKKVVSFILDMSGSMTTCRAAAISGFNEFLGNLQREPGMAIFFSLTLFNSETRIKHAAVPVAEVPDLDHTSYVPDHQTALYDAIGRTLSLLEARMKGDTTTPVVVVILTDGQENDSREFTREAIAARIAALQAQPNWTFAFMGADQDAWLASQKIGIPRANTLSYSSGATGQSIGTTSSTVVDHLRSGRKQSRKLYDDPA